MKRVGLALFLKVGNPWQTWPGIHTGPDMTRVLWGYFAVGALLRHPTLIIADLVCNQPEPELGQKYVKQRISSWLNWKPR
jgi:hypothetical protein